MKNSTILKRAKKLIESPERWAKGAFRTCDGKHCMHGAVNASRRVGELSTSVSTLFGVPAAIEKVWRFNDAPDTTHDDVMTAFDFAILMAEDEERAKRSEAKS